MQRIICIWFPYLESERLIRQNPDLSQKPFVLVAREANRVFVSALSKAAGDMGFETDMSLVDVRAATPDMMYHEMDPAGDIRCLRGLMRWASRFTPRVARGEGSNLYLDIAGASHLFGGEAALLETLHGQLQALGFTTHLALADTQAVAWGFAHFGKNKSNITADILRETSQDLSVEALQMSYASTTLCQRLGLKKIGALLELPRASLASRIGLEDLKQVDRFFGSAAEARQFARYRERLIEEKQFFDPLATTAGIEAAVDELLAKLCARLSQMQRGFRKASLWMDRVDHQNVSFSIQLMQPSIDLTVLKRLFSRHFEQLDVGFGIDRMRLVADQVAPLSQRQLGLEDSKKQNHEDNLNRLVNELSNMFGGRQVRQFFPADSHIPEQTFTQKPILQSSPRPESWSRTTAKRPIRLFKKPVSVLVQDGLDETTPDRIFWHGRECRLTVLTGPERIEPNWWRHDPDWQNGARDYWWAKTHFGALLWLYRVSDDEKTQWFVHGMGS